MSPSKLIGGAHVPIVYWGTRQRLDLPQVVLLGGFVEWGVLSHTLLHLGIIPGYVLINYF